MSLYIIEDDDHNVLTNDGVFDNNMINAALFDEPTEPAQDVKVYGGHVVELIEKAAPILVSQEEAKILSIKDTSKLLHEIDVYANFLDTCGKPHPETVMRLMRACVVGWVVAKPKRYLVRVPHANRHYYYQKCDSGEVIPICDMEKEPPTQFTDAEIEHYGLQDCEKVEAKQHDE